MTNTTLKPINGNQTENSRTSIRRVLYVKILRCIDRATIKQTLRATKKLTYAVSILVVIASPSYAAGVLVDVAQWNQYRLPIGAVLFFTIWYMPTVIRCLRKTRIRRRNGNQHTFEGIGISEIASYLIDRGAFPLKETMKHFALSQPVWRKIAKKLEAHKILVRGENNSLILGEISREELVTQLREDFPLVYSEHDKAWCERRGNFDQWVLQKERAERADIKAVEKKERKIKRLDNAIQERSEALFTSRQLESPTPLSAVFAHNG